MFSLQANKNTPSSSSSFSVMIFSDETANVRISCNAMMLLPLAKSALNIWFHKAVFAASPFNLIHPRFYSTLVSSVEDCAFEDEILWFLIAHDVQNNCVRLCFSRENVSVKLHQRLKSGSHVKAFSGLIFDSISSKLLVAWRQRLAFRSLIIIFHWFVHLSYAARSSIPILGRREYFSLLMTCDEFKLSENLFTTERKKWFMTNRAVVFDLNSLFLLSSSERGKDSRNKN